MSVELRDDFESAQVDFDETLDLFCEAYGISPGDTIYHTRYTPNAKGDKVYSISGGSPEACMRWWLEDLQDRGHNVYNSVGYIYGHLNELAERRREYGDQAVVEKLYGSPDALRGRIESAIEQSGLSKQQFAEFLMTSPQYHFANDFSRGDVVDRLIETYGDMGALSHAQANAHTICEVMGREKPPMSALDTPINKSLIHIANTPIMRKLEAQTEERRQRREARQGRDEVVAKSKAELKLSRAENTRRYNDIGNRAINVKHAIVKNRYELSKQIRKHSLERLDRSLNRDLKKAFKGLSNQAQKTRIENYWNSPEGRVRQANILKVATTLSHTTRGIHGERVRQNPSKQDIKNAERVFQNIRQSGSISKATSWAEIHKVIATATEQSSKKQGIELKQPRLVDVYSKAHGAKMTAKDAYKNIDLDNLSEALTIKDRTLAGQTIRDRDTKIESVAPERATDKDKREFDNARQQLKDDPERSAKFADPDYTTEKDIEVAESAAYNKDSRMAAKDLDDSLDDTPEMKQKTDMLNQVETENRYDRDYENASDKYEGDRGAKDTDLKNERQKDTRMEKARARTHEKGLDPDSDTGQGD